VKEKMRGMEDLETREERSWLKYNHLKRLKYLEFTVRKM
jgi:hypothetical protein